MTLFKSPGQFIITPAIGIVKDGSGIYLNISWLMYGVNFMIYEVITKTKKDDAK